MGQGMIMADGIKSMVIFAMLFFTASLHAQNQDKADSLVKVLETKKVEGEQLLELLYLIGDSQTQPEQIRTYANKLIEASQTSNYYKYEILGYINLGYGYKLQGRLTDAMQAYLEAAEVAYEIDNLIAAADAYSNIASLYTSSGDYSKSLEFYSKAQNLYEEEASPNRLAGFYINYGYATYKTQQYDSALRILEKAKYYSKKLGSDIHIAYTQANIALSLANKKEFQRAEQQLDSAMAVMRKSEDYYGLSDCLIEMGGVYLDNDQVNRAIKMLSQGYDIAIENGLKEQVQNAAKNLAQAYKNLGDIEKAFEYQSKYYTYRDSLINAEQIRKLADQRTEFEVGQKQAEVDLLTAEKRTQQIIIFSVTGGAILVIVLLGMVYKNYRDKNRINKILEDQKRQLEELNNTKDKFFSIISHDLRGPVSAFAGISRLIKYSVQSKNTDDLTEIADHIDQTVDHLSGLLDNLLNWAMQQQGHFPYVPEKLDLTQLSNEIKGIFSTMAQGKNITLATEIENDIQLWADKNTTMTILRNLVNNALKFTEGGGKVSISAQEQGDMVEIKVSDTGVGMSEEKLNSLFKMDGKKSDFGTAGEKGLGLGLQLVYEFVEMNNGTIKVESEERKGTTFILKFPLFAASEVETTV